MNDEFMSINDGCYLYDTIEECRESGDHMTNCDDDGFCNYCGEQDWEDE